MRNIVIPMAGAGKRFVEAGFKLPKPLIDVLGKPMICHVIEQFYCPEENRITLLVRQEHYSQEEKTFREIQEKYGAGIRMVPRLTEGTACTVLEAYDIINTSEQLVIANSDQLVDYSMVDYLRNINSDLDGDILCFKSQDPKWSYIYYEGTRVVGVVEKCVVSEIATVGIYYFKQGKNFVDAARQMILADDRVNREFYTAPSYNYLIKSGGNVSYTLIEESQMHGLGTPKDLEEFIKWKSEN